MDTRLTIRQISFMFLFLSLSSIFNYIPNLTAANAGGTGYIAVIYGGILMFVYAALLLQILKTFPKMNLYEVLKEILTKWPAKLIILLYAIWAYMNVLLKIGAYSVTLQATLMPSIHPGILLVILFLLIIYTLTKNSRTIFRVSEFLYQPIIIFLAIMFLFGLPALEFTELVPVGVQDLENNMYSIPAVCTIGGNLVLLLFFCKELIYSGNVRDITRRVMNTVFTFIMIGVLAIVLSVGMNGADTTAKLSYPIFQSMKGVSVLNTFERFDSVMTMIAMMSDFVGIFVFLQVTMLCIGWLFNYQEKEKSAMLNSSDPESKVMNNSLKVYGAVLFFLASVYVLLRDVTQFEFESFYRGFLTYLNLIFQILVPVIVSLICIAKQIGRKEREKRMADENN